MAIAAPWITCKSKMPFPAHGTMGNIPGLAAWVKPPPKSSLGSVVPGMPDKQALLRIVNKIFRTRCEDADAIEAAGAWELIIEELKPYDQAVALLVLHYQTGLTLKEVSRALELPVHRVHLICSNAFAKLRHPCRITRIRNSIMGWPNLYRYARQSGNATKGKPAVPCPASRPLPAQFYRMQVGLLLS